MKNQVKKLTYFKDRLSSFMDMEEGWNGHGSEPPSEDACKSAWEVLKMLFGQSAMAVYVYPGERGSVEIEVDNYDDNGNLSDEFRLEVTHKGVVLADDARSQEWWSSL